MKTEHIDLLETCPAGGPDSSRRFKINGKPCTREEFRAVKNRAYVPPGRLECCETANKGGVWHFYSVAILPCSATAPRCDGGATPPTHQPISLPMKTTDLRHRFASRAFAPIPHSRIVALFLARNAATLERASTLSREMANPGEALRLATATEAFFSK